jgi:hypothetical protein
MTTDYCEGMCAEELRMRRIRGRSDDPGDELAQGAVVFLVDAGAARGAMIFRVWTYRGNDRAARGGRVD